jgi:tetratricopeptide (TPR) repeat protein
VGQTDFARTAPADLATVAGAPFLRYNRAAVPKAVPASFAFAFAPRAATLTVAALASALLGCDALGARFRAREGVDLYHAHDYAGAARKFEEASRLDPGLAVLTLNAGTSNLALFRALGGKSADGQTAATRTITAYERYLDLRPQDERVKAALVQTFVETGRYEDAVAFFRPAIAKNDVEALSVLATVATKCNKPDEALSWHDKRIAAAPDKPEGYIALGVFLWQELHDHPDWPHDKRKPKADVAIEKLKKAIELQPHAPNAYTYVNLVYRELAATEPDADAKKKDLEEANKYFQLALERQKG